MEISVLGYDWTNVPLSDQLNLETGGESLIFFRKISQSDFQCSVVTTLRLAERRQQAETGLRLGLTCFY